jgi:hypothetical protein
MSRRGTIHASGSLSMKDDSRHATPIDIESKGAIDGQEHFISDNDQQSVVIGLPQPNLNITRNSNHVPSDRHRRSAVL